ncbi:MAG: IPTL-CTERM sorting domain-containing protein [Chitinophagales bacterium]
MKKLFLIKTLSFCLFFFLFHSSSVFGGVPGSVNANFAADKATVVVGETVTFTDISTDNCSLVIPVGADAITSWNWNFGVDATPATANTEGPHAVSYSSGGTKNISMNANSSFANCSSDSFSMMITVIAAAAPGVPTLSEWGLILLALLLMNLGSVFIAQEKLALATPRNFKLPLIPFQLPFSAEYFNKAMVLTAIFAFMGFAGSIVFTGTIAASDLIGVFVTAPVFAYLVHLVWLLKEK